MKYYISKCVARGTVYQVRIYCWHIEQNHETNVWT